MPPEARVTDARTTTHSVHAIECTVTVTPGVTLGLIRPKRLRVRPWPSQLAATNAKRVDHGGSRGQSTGKEARLWIDGRFRERRQAPVVRRSEPRSSVALVRRPDHRYRPGPGAEPGATSSRRRYRSMDHFWIPPLSASVRKRAHRAAVSAVGQSPASVNAVISSDSSHARISAGVTKTRVCGLDRRHGRPSRRETRTDQHRHHELRHARLQRCGGATRDDVRRPAEAHAPRSDRFQCPDQPIGECLFH